jgi:hypothetical protein
MVHWLATCSVKDGRRSMQMLAMALLVSTLTAGLAIAAIL